MADPQTSPAVAETGFVVELPMQRATRERLLDGMGSIIRRMTRHCGPHPQTGIQMLCLCDHDERELAIELFSYLEGMRRV